MKSRIIKKSAGSKVNVPNFQKLLVHECDDLLIFDLYSCVESLDTTKKLYGNASIELVKTGDAVGYFVATVTKAVDLTRYKNLVFSFYTANKSNLGSIGIVLFTSTPFDYGESYIKYVSPTPMINGWNTIKVPLVASDFIIAGVKDWSTTTGIRFTVNITVDNITETVNFDKVYLNK